MRFTLYPICGVADPWDDEPFDTSTLPFEITEHVNLEAVEDRIREGAFNLSRQMIGASAIERLENVRYALVHRYDPAPVLEEDHIVNDGEHQVRSDQLLREIAACLRIIRPMRQRALVMRGVVRDEDGTFDVSGFELPAIYGHEVPEVQKYFDVRNRDANDLRTYVPDFLREIRNPIISKFRMAVQFHDLGHFSSDWKARYLLWSSAVESIFTTHNREHQGTRVATARIKWFLGERTSIYAPGDLTRLLEDPTITVGNIVDDVYAVRNYLAHGDRIPDEYFNQMARQSFNGGVPRIEVLLEAVSFIIRTSLLKILRDGLLNHFQDAVSADAFSVHKD